MAAGDSQADGFQRALDLISIEMLFEALPLLNEVIGAQPERVEAYVQRAKVRRRLKDDEGAIADYTQAIKLAPTAALYLSRALVWLSLDQVKGAIADSREVVRLAPDLAGGHRLLGKALGKLGDGVGAIAAYKRAARCYLNDKDKENAQACLDAIGPLRELPGFDYAQPSGADQVRENNLFEGGSAADYVRLVRLKYEAGEYAAAMKDLDWLLACDPMQVDALCLRGLIQAQLGRRDLAIADLASAKQQSDAPDVRFCQGQMRLILKDGYGAVEEFSALIDQAQRSNSPVAKYFAARGDGYRLIGDLDEAFKDYSNAVAIDSKNAALYELRAETQQSMNGVEGAIADFQKAATLWLNKGDWRRHQRVVEAVRALRAKGSGDFSPRNSTVVPIKHFSNHRPVVDALFDGISTFEMVVDRNATHSIVTQRMASLLNLEAVSYQYVYLLDGTPMELSLGRLRSVRLGGAVFTDVYVAIAPDSATAVLGKDCFSPYRIQISGNEIIFVRR